MRGKFITLEGIDGAGKSTHHAWLVHHLEQAGKRVLATREPGGTPLGEKLRALILSESMDLETETLMMFAARREHLVKAILPALDAGTWVVSDRFTDATYAYQGGGRGLAGAKIEILESWVQEGRQPDLTLVFDLPISVALARLGKTGVAPDRFELETAEFFERVRSAYLDRARRWPERVQIVDAQGTIGEIQKRLEDIVAII